MMENFPLIENCNSCSKRKTRKLVLGRSDHNIIGSYLALRICTKLSHVHENAVCKLVPRGALIMVVDLDYCVFAPYNSEGQGFRSIILIRFGIRFYDLHDILLKRNFHWLGPGATFCWWYF
jgi:hypothetical protein